MSRNKCPQCNYEMEPDTPCWVCHKISSYEKTIADQMTEIAALTEHCNAEIRASESMVSRIEALIPESAYIGDQSAPDNLAGHVQSLKARAEKAEAEVERLRQLLDGHEVMFGALKGVCNSANARAEKAEKERDEAMADVGILKRGMLGDYDLDAWLDWVKKADALKARAQKAELEVKDMNGLIFELSKKAPHLNGCAKLVNGGWLCDERCLVDKLEKTEAHLRESDRVMDEVLEENSKLEALVKELREALIAAENVLKRCDHDNDRKCDQCDAWDKARAALAKVTP